MAQPNAFLRRGCRGHVAYPNRQSSSQGSPETWPQPSPERASRIENRTARSPNEILAVHDALDLLRTELGLAHERNAFLDCELAGADVAEELRIGLNFDLIVGDNIAGDLAAH